MLASRAAALALYSFDSTAKDNFFSDAKEVSSLISMAAFVHSPISLAVMSAPHDGSNATHAKVSLTNLLPLCQGRPINSKFLES